MGDALELTPEDDVIYAFGTVFGRDGSVADWETPAVRRRSGQFEGAGTAAASATGVMDVVRKTRFMPAQTPMGQAVAVDVVLVIAEDDRLDGPGVVCETSRRSDRSEGQGHREAAVRSCLQPAASSAVSRLSPALVLQRPPDLPPAAGASPLALADVVQRIGRPDDHPAGGRLSLQHQFELLDPRVGNAVPRVDRLPACRRRVSSRPVARPSTRHAPRTRARAARLRGAPRTS